MLPSEVFGLGVLLPKDSLAMVRLQADDVERGMNIDHLPLTRKQLADYFPLINDINRTCGTSIESRQTSEVEHDQLTLVIDFLRSRRSPDDPAFAEFQEQVLALAERAKDLHMSLFFIL